MAELVLEPVSMFYQNFLCDVACYGVLHCSLGAESLMLCLAF